MRVLFAFILGLVALAASAQGQDGVDTRGSFRKAEAFHILVKDERTAEQLRDELAVTPAEVRLEAFRRLARRHSIDPDGAASSGALGQVWQGELVNFLDQAIFGSKVGEVGPAVRSDLGWHLFYVSGFQAEPVAAFCDNTLRAALAKASAVQKQVLDMSLRPLDRAQLMLEVSTFLEGDWSAPLQDRQGNLVLLSRPEEQPDGLRFIRRHVDFLHPWAKPSAASKACTRSRRETWVLNCATRRAGLSEAIDYEGRVAAGAQVGRTRFHRASGPADVEFQPLEQATFGAQLLAHGCGR